MFRVLPAIFRLPAVCPMSRYSGVSEVVLAFLCRFLNGKLGAVAPERSPIRVGRVAPTTLISLEKSLR